MQIVLENDQLGKQTKEKIEDAYGSSVIDFQKRTRKSTQLLVPIKGKIVKCSVYVPSFGIPHYCNLRLSLQSCLHCQQVFCNKHFGIHKITGK